MVLDVLIVAYLFPISLDDAVDARTSTPLRKTLTALSMFALLAVGSASLKLEGALHVMVKGRSELYAIQTITPFYLLNLISVNLIRPKS